MIKQLVIGLTLLISINLQAQDIRMDITIKAEKNVIVDTLTKCIVNNLSDGIKTTVNCENLQIYLKPDCEFVLLFVRQGYKSKQVYVSTIDCFKGSYRINTTIELHKGTSDTIIKAGYMWYDNIAKTFNWIAKQREVIKKNKELLVIK